MNKKGFTLIEMLVAVTVFISVITAGSGLFVFGLRVQRQSLAWQQLLAQTSYLMEYMSRAVRMARKDMNGTCTGTAKLNYKWVGQCLKFRNYKNECQQFCLDGDRLKEIKAGSENYLTSDELQISPFNVELAGQSQYDNIQPRVTIFLEITGKEGSKIKIQTTISQRNLDVRH